ncbi:MAG: type II toxin-antitoxin system Phd/YefM family antitoxin [Anaerolineales bacterium]|nr:type II toxin-antitoxin system Phd/YefM family antitoxin [Anaerolineales bacterium]
MVKTWQLQEAKNKFSQVVKDASTAGPQVVTRHGTEVAVVLSYEEYRKLMASQPKLSTFFRESPLFNIPLDLERDKTPAREEFAF